MLYNVYMSCPLQENKTRQLKNGGWAWGYGDVYRILKLKLRQIGTHEVLLRGFPSLAGLVGPVHDNIFMYRRHGLRTFHIDVDF